MESIDRDRNPQSRPAESPQESQNRQSGPGTDIWPKKRIFGQEIFEITPEDANYPELLHMINDKPKKLYYTGDISALSGICVSVVGSRHATDYGRWAAFEIGKRLAQCGVTVVSGMASGIDSFAHKGALEAGGMTAAVLGCGLDICFPKMNRLLMEEIANKGVLLSEYPLGTEPARFTFPRRNRIISGVSAATVVVEAGLGSGSLITAEKAADQGRAVYAVPGNINNLYSIGTNKLIRDGAIGICVIDDIIADLGLLGEAQTATAELGAEELRVLAAVGGGGETTIDSICEKTLMTPGKITGIVTVLEMKGYLHTELGKIFVAK